MPAWAALVLATAIGFVMPVQSRINGELSAQTGNPSLTAFFSFAGGLALLCVLSAFSARLRSGIRAIGPAIASGELRWWYLSAGALGAALVLTQSVVVALAGVSLFTVTVVAGQALGGTLVDAIGFGGHHRRLPTLTRGLGALLVLTAVWFSAAPQSGAAPSATYALAAAAGIVVGAASAFQQAMNGRIRVISGVVMAAAFTNFVSGTAVLAIAALVSLIRTGLPGSLPTQWWLYTGGMLGIVFIAGGAALVTRLGVLVLSVASVFGQIVGSVLLDALWPIGEAGVSSSTLVGAGLALLAVIVISVSNVSRVRVIGRRAH